MVVVSKIALGHRGIPRNSEEFRRNPRNSKEIRRIPKNSEEFRYFRFGFPISSRKSDFSSRKMKIQEFRRGIPINSIIYKFLEEFHNFLAEFLGFPKNSELHVISKNSSDYIKIPRYSVEFREETVQSWRLQPYYIILYY